MLDWRNRIIRYIFIKERANYTVRVIRADIYSLNGKIHRKYLDQWLALTNYSISVNQHIFIRC